jgi:WD40 repeat protein
LTLPHQVEIAGARQAKTLLTDLTTLLDERIAGKDGPELYFFIAGLHRWRALRSSDAFRQSEAAKKLSSLADEGPEMGIHLIAWSDGIANLLRAMGRGAIKDFDLRVALRLPEADSSALFGSRVASKLKDNRALFRHEEWEAGKVEKFKPYTLLDEATLNQITQRLTKKATRQFRSDSVSSLAFSPADSSSLACASWQQTAVKVWDIGIGVPSGQVRQTLSGHSKYVWSVAFSPDGKSLASGSHDGTVKVWEVATGKLLQTFKQHQKAVTSVAFSPDALLLASGSADNTLIVWDVQTGQPRHTLKGHTGSVLSVAFRCRADGKSLASASYDGTLKTWDVQTGKLLHTFWGHNAGVRCLAFSPDGLMLASGSWDKRVKLWDVQTGKFLHTLKGHNSLVTTVAFSNEQRSASPNGFLLASGSYDQTVKLWSIKSKQLHQTLSGHSSAVSSVAFSADGKQLASGDQDGNVMLWPL